MRLPRFCRPGRRSNQVLIQFLLLMMLNFAFGAITYFSLAATGHYPSSTPDEDSNRLPYILSGNALEALLVLVCLRGWMRHVHTRLPGWLSHLFFLVFLVLAVALIPAMLFWNYYYGYRLQELLHGSVWAWAFSMDAVAAGMLALSIFSREEKRAHRITQQEFALLEMKELKTKAELEALQAKINPHFLYNALNSIASLIPEDPERAEKMVLLLAKFFRYSTNAGSLHLTTVREELDMVSTYLEMEKVRFGERLEYAVFIQGEEVANCLIPRFLIQPLVENAIKHGIARLPGNGIVSIKVLDKGEHLLILVIDNGAPFPAEVRYGYGLRSTQDKLRLLCGEDAVMEIQEDTGYQYTSGGIQLPPGTTGNEHYKCISLTLRKQVPA